MRVDDCEMLEIIPERLALTYRFRHVRSGEILCLHIVPDSGEGEPECMTLLKALTSPDRKRILDHGRQGSLSYFISQGVPLEDGFLAWLSRAAHPGGASALTRERYRIARDIFERALLLPRGERASFVRGECGSERADCGKILEMLRASEQEGGFLEVPAAQQVAAGNPVAKADDDLPPVNEFALGACINDRYTIWGTVGRGGFGIIYGARDSQVHNKRVVLKVGAGASGPMDPDLLARFQREAASLARIAHPGVVGVLDMGTSPGGTPYFVMPYVPGRTLRQALRDDGAFPLPRAAGIVQQISHALTVTHNEGVCHRDLKPENIMLQDLGDGEELAIIIDFGIATMRERIGDGTSLTRVLGTPAYMSPEQLDGRPVPASDTFALGVIAWEMITGGLPDHPPKRLPTGKALPKAVEKSIRRALSSDYRLRHKRTRDFGDELWLAVQPHPRRIRDRLVYGTLPAALGLATGLALVTVYQAHTGGSPSITPSTRENPRGYRLHLAAPRDGMFFIVEEKKKGRFEILWPPLSYFGPVIRYLTLKTVDFPPDGSWLPAGPGSGPRLVWIFWAEQRVDAVEELARVQAIAPAEAVRGGLAAPGLAALAGTVRDAGGERSSRGLFIRLIRLAE